MFCKNCGKENAGEAKFCVSCGFDFAQSTPPTAAAPSRAAATTKPKKRAKLPIILACMVVVALFALYQLGANAAEPEKVVEKYIAAFAVADYDAVYDSLELTSDIFTTQEIFTAAHAISVDMSHNKVTSISITPATAKDVEDIELLSGSVVDAAYQVTYSTVVNPQPFMETVLLTKSGKLFGLFDRYKIEPSQLVAQYYTITAPAGIAVYLDGIQLDDSLISNVKAQTRKNDSENPIAKNVYTIPSIFVGEHTITATSDFTEEYIAPVFIKNGSDQQINDLVIKADVRTQMRASAEEVLKVFFAGAVEKKSFEEIAPQLNILPAQIEDVRKEYDLFCKTDWSGYSKNSVVYKGISLTDVAEEQEGDSGLTNRIKSPLAQTIKFEVTCDVAPAQGYILVSGYHIVHNFSLNVQYAYDNGTLSIYSVAR